MASGAREWRGAGAHAAGGDELVLGRVAAIGLSHLEQGEVGEAAVAVPLHG
jgi:hypothetical protein